MKYSQSRTQYLFTDSKGNDIHGMDIVEWTPTDPGLTFGGFYDIHPNLYLIDELVFGTDDPRDPLGPRYYIFEAVANIPEIAYPYEVVKVNLDRLESCDAAWVREFKHMVNWPLAN